MRRWRLSRSWASEQEVCITIVDAFFCHLILQDVQIVGLLEAWIRAFLDLWCFVCSDLLLT